MLNRVILIGRLTKDPELRYTPNGIAVTTFTLAIDRSYKSASGERETDFINIVVWRGLAENCANYLQKGKLAAVDGKLQIRNYETKDGQKRTVAEVVADDVRFLSPRDASNPKSGVSSDNVEAQDNSPSSSFVKSDDFSMGDDDLPF